MHPAKNYFKTLFEDDGDCAMFLFKHYAQHIDRGQSSPLNTYSLTVSDGMGRWEVYDKAPGEDGATLNSNPMAPDDTRLLPAIVEHYFYNPRHRKMDHLHYYWLHWYVGGQETASVKVERGADGCFPIVAYDPTRNLLVQGTPSEVWAKVPAASSRPE